MPRLHPAPRRALALLCSLLITAPAVAAPIAGVPDPGGSPAQPGAWEPGEGERTELSTDDLRFHGWHRLDPLRVHLSRGGFFDGGLAGVDRDRDRLLLVDRTGSVAIDFSLILTVTPLGLPRDPRGAEGELLSEPEIDADPAVRWVLRPTWRSHLGATLSALVPGTGQFIQKEERWLGGVFLGTWSFLVASAMLALFAPSDQPTQVRSGLAVGFLGVAGGFNVLSAVHAHRAGRERTREVRRHDPTSGPADLTPRAAGK